MEAQLDHNQSLQEEEVRMTPRASPECSPWLPCKFIADQIYRQEVAVAGAGTNFWERTCNVSGERSS